MKIDAVVLGCWENGYGIVRELAEKKLRVAGVFLEREEAWRHSRYLAESVRAPHPTREPSAFVEFLLSRRDRWRGALVIPTNDHYVEALSRNKAALSCSYAVLAEEYSAVAKLLDKSKLYQSAQSIGIPTPAVFCLNGSSGLEEIRERIHLPCLLKPLEGHRFFEAYKQKLFVVKSVEELVQKFQDIQKKGLRASVQEIVTGPDTNLYTHLMYLDEKGRILFEGTRKKLRQKPVHFGDARATRTEFNQELAQMTKRLADLFSLKGFFGFEFKRDERDQTWKLLDGHSRFVSNHLVFQKAGVNLAYLIYLDRVKGVQTEKQVPRDNVYWVNLHEDIRHTFFMKSDEKLPFREFLEPYFHEHIFADVDFRDPFPFLVRVFSVILESVKRELKRGLQSIPGISAVFSRLGKDGLKQPAALKSMQVGGPSCE